MQKAALQYTKVVGQNGAAHRASQRPQPPLGDTSARSWQSQVIVENAAVDSARLPHLMEDWLADCQIRNHSPQTIELRRVLCNRLNWFLQYRQYTSCSRTELRQFFAYLVGGHDAEQGRGGRPEPRYRKVLRPATVDMYHNHLLIFA